MDWQGSVLGYRPTIGELIVATILAILAAQGARLISRAWEFLLDLISTSFDKLRIRRINILEERLKTIVLYEENDRKAILRLVKRAILLVIIIGFLSITAIVYDNAAVIRSIDYIISYLHIPVPLFPGVLSHNTYVGDFDMLIDDIFFTVFSIILMPAIIIAMYLVSSVMQDIDDISDPAKAIRALEERIGALMAKGA